jgi:maleate cis-trans isomerase
MFEEFIPQRKLGVLTPLAVNDNAPYEFYRIAPEGVMMVMTPCGLREFSSEDVERVFAPIDALVDSLMQRQVDILIQSGVPLPILIGIEKHDRLLARMAERSGKPVSSSITAVVAAARHLGIRKIAVANKWDDKMNACLAAFFAREGVGFAGAATEVMGPAQFQAMGTGDSMDLAYVLGRQALERFADADGLYIGGGAWMAQPVCERLEREFDKPCIGNQGSVVWDALHRVNFWKPIPGHGRLLAGD